MIRKYKQKKTVHSKKFKGRWIIISDNNKYIRELNEVASIIWDLLKKPCSEQTLCNVIKNKYKGKPSVIQKDVHIFLTNYEKDGLIERVDDHT
jgi:hypothetical protein